MPPEQGTHAFDPDQSNAQFSVRTLWLSSIEGEFGRLSGFLRVHPDGMVSVHAWIDMDQLRMDRERYADTLRSAAFFNVARYDHIRFRSTLFNRDLLIHGGNVYGWLTLRGQTRPVRFELLPAHCERALYDACTLRLRGTIERSAFGMTAHGLTVSDRVRLRLSIALARSPAA